MVILQTTLTLAMQALSGSVSIGGSEGSLSQAFIQPRRACPSTCLWETQPLDLQELSAGVTAAPPPLPGLLVSLALAPHPSP